MMLFLGVKIVVTYRALKAFKNRVLRRMHEPRRGISESLGNYTARGFIL
jgi:hypothetical protein